MYRNARTLSALWFECVGESMVGAGILAKNEIIESPAAIWGGSVANWDWEGKGGEAGDMLDAEWAAVLACWRSCKGGNDTGEGITSSPSSTDGRGTAWARERESIEATVPAPERACQDGGNATGDGIMARKSNAGSEAADTGGRHAAWDLEEEGGMPPERIRADLGGDGGNVTGDGIMARKSNTVSEAADVGGRRAAWDLEEEGRMPPERIRADFGGILLNRTPICWHSRYGCIKCNGANYVLYTELPMCSCLPQSRLIVWLHMSIWAINYELCCGVAASELIGDR